MELLINILFFAKCALNKVGKFIFKYKLLLNFLLFFLTIFIDIYFKITNFNEFFLFNIFKSNKKKIKVAFYNNCFRYGGIERVTSILLKYLSKEKYFIFLLITISGILQGEYEIPKNIRRISLSQEKTNIFEVIKKEHIEILIYNYDNRKEIAKLNKLNITKVIYTTHSSFFYRIYENKYNINKTVYHEYMRCKYVTSLIPLENDYLFKKWGINSILLENPCTYDYDSVIPSDLSQKNIIMIGRGSYFAKRFDLGIRAMKNIIKEIPECKMNIISSSSKNLEELIKSLNLENAIKISGFQKNLTSYLKDASLHIMTSLSEAYPMSLGEVKIFGIPSILCGLDYLVLSKGGNIIIYDDNPITIAKESIKILKNKTYREKLGKEARKSMKKLSNHFIIKKWLKLLFSVYNGIDKYSYSQLFINNNNRITEKEADIILNNQLYLLKKRKHIFRGITLEKLKSFTLES